MSRKFIILLIGIHLGIGVLAVSLSTGHPNVLSAFVIAVVFCQASLIGLWVGFGSAPAIFRLFALAIATGYLSGLLMFGLNGDDEILVLLVAVAIGGVALCAWIHRVLHSRGGRSDALEEPTPEILQFSIRHLMIFTATVACLIALGQLLAPLLPYADDTVQIVIVALCHVALALVTTWTALGIGNPVIRIPFLLLVTGLAAVVIGYVVDSHEDLWAFIAVVHAVLLFVSLRVVRMTGYRLVSKRRKPVHNGGLAS